MREVVSPRSGMATLVLMFMGGSIVYGIGKQAGADTWLPVIAAVLLAVPMILIYARLVDLSPNHDVLETMEQALGRPLASVVVIIYGWYALQVMYESVSNLGNFVVVAGLTETPKVVPALSLLLISLLAAKLGIEVLTRWSGVLLVVIILISVSAFVLVLQEVDLTNFLPVLYNGVLPVAVGTLSLLEFPFLEAVIFMFSGAAYQRPGGARQVMIWGHFLAGAVILFIISLTIAVVGPQIYQMLYYPVYGAVSRIDVAGFLTRLEFTVSFIFLVTTFVKTSVCLIAACRCVGFLMGESNYTYFATPLALSGIVGTFWIAEGTLEMEEMSLQLWPPLELAVQLILPAAIWITAEIRLKKGKEPGTKKAPA